MTIIYMDDVREYINTFEWGSDTSDDIKTLVLDNINGFIHWLENKYDISVKENRVKK